MKKAHIASSQGIKIHSLVVPVVFKKKWYTDFLKCEVVWSVCGSTRRAYLLKREGAVIRTRNNSPDEVLGNVAGGQDTHIREWGVVAASQGRRLPGVGSSEEMVPFDDLTLVESSNTDVDRFVGNRIRERRVMLGLSQQQMAQMIGVTYQQAHKYERGINRISAGRLYEIARVLRVPVGYFFEGLDGANGEDELSMRQRMCLELARNFTQIPSERHREALSQLARALAAK